MSWRMEMEVALCLAVMALASTVSGQTNVAGLKVDAAAPLVVMKQAEIKGRVLVITEQEDGQPLGASDVQVVVRDPEKQGNVIEVRTEQDGGFVLPDLDVGTFELQVARLKLRLRVEDPGKAAEEKLFASKVLVVFLPQEMLVE